MCLKITLKINANRPAKNKLINQKKSRLKAEGLLEPPLKETGLRKPFVQLKFIPSYWILVQASQLWLIHLIKTSIGLMVEKNHQSGQKRQ